MVYYFVILYLPESTGKKFVKMLYNNVNLFETIEHEHCIKHTFRHLLLVKTNRFQLYVRYNIKSQHIWRRFYSFFLLSKIFYQKPHGSIINYVFFQPEFSTYFFHSFSAMLRILMQKIYRHTVHQPKSISDISVDLIGFCL